MFSYRKSVFFFIDAEKILNYAFVCFHHFLFFCFITLPLSFFCVSVSLFITNIFLPFWLCDLEVPYMRFTSFLFGFLAFQGPHESCWVSVNVCVCTCERVVLFLRFNQINHRKFFLFMYVCVFPSDKGSKGSFFFNFVYKSFYFFFRGLSIE